MPAVAGRSLDLGRSGDREAIRVEDSGERERGLRTPFLLGNFLSFPLLTY